MAKISTDIPADLARQVERVIRDGWFPDNETLLREALVQFIDTKSFLGDSPRMLHRFAADALNESKPETAVKFVDRALALMSPQKLTDLSLYQSLIELKVQVLLVLDRPEDAVATLEEAREHLPNSPNIARWLERAKKRK
ncbi:MAG TPA: hypothetical protein VEZ11_14405 [Thermoanaerobaculia bacterium]|nr:hypothetical protein [Thermoanaerobaculia bacterium]